MKTMGSGTTFTGPALLLPVRLLSVLMLLTSCGGSGSGDDSFATPPLRASNSSCIAPDTPAPASGAIELIAAFPRLPTIPGLLGLYQAPDDTSRWYALSQTGRVLQFDNNADAADYRVFLDLEQETFSASSEAGLLGLAFHPRYPVNGQVFVYYMPTVDSARLSRFTLDAAGTRLDKNSEKVILSIGQPAANHNGGGLGFGPDAYLYLSLGDGGGANDTFGNGQNTGTLLGTLLRLDVDVSNDDIPYEIPADNPFADGQGGRPEIYAYGLRNPWRWSFDRLTGELWLGDVGQFEIEEIDIITRGANYGWPIMEGNSCFNANQCDRNGLTPPVIDYSHDDTDGCSVTGGYVYRGSANSTLTGHYIFADFCSGIVYGIAPEAPSTFVKLVDSSLALGSFAEDHDGELYALDLQGGDGTGIYRIAAASIDGDSLIPDKLSDTGCFDQANRQNPAQGVVPYTVNSSFWSDGADKQRYFAIPDNTRISIDAAGEFIFPDGSVLIKHFYYGDEILETRLFMKHLSGWAGYSYEWNSDKTDATLLAAGVETAIDTSYRHIFPDRGQCLECHTAAAGWSLGLETLQLNTAESAGHPDSLARLQQLGYIEGDVPAVLLQSSLSGLDDEQAGTEHKARSYLHSNCSNCHRPGGPIAGIDLRFGTALSDSGVCNAVPDYGDLGQADARLLIPGDAGRSVISLRMQDTGGQRMPPLASNVIDNKAVETINAWINSLSSCGS